MINKGQEMSLAIELKMSYKQEKSMKKMMGKLTGYQIAVGRRLLKTIQSNYSSPERIKQEDSCKHNWLKERGNSYIECMTCGVLNIQQSE